MKETEYDDEEEYSEEHGEDVRITARQENESYEGGDSSIEDGGAHVHHGGRRSLLPAAGDGEEGVADVDGVVDTESDGDDDVDSADDVNADVPGVHEATQVDETEGDRAEDKNGSEEVSQEDESGEEDTGEGDTKISEEFPGDHLVCLPVRIFLQLVDSQ